MVGSVYGLSFSLLAPALSLPCPHVSLSPLEAIPANVIMFGVLTVSSVK